MHDVPYDTPPSVGPGSKGREQSEEPIYANTSDAGKGQLKKNFTETLNALFFIAAAPHVIYN